MLNADFTASPGRAVSGQILSFSIRASVTGFAFWWMLQSMELGTLVDVLRSARVGWILAGVALFLLSEVASLARWKLLVLKHPAARWPFLTNFFLVGSFFNTFLPTTVGGDVVRVYALTKATGRWQESLASVLMDRLLGVITFGLFAMVGWAGFAPARQIPLVRYSFFGFCLVLTLVFLVLSSKRILNTVLKLMSPIGLAQWGSRARQLRESIFAYSRRPKLLLQAFGVSLGVQTLAICMFFAVSKALGLSLSFLLLSLMVPLLSMVAQFPISLNGWGLREGSAVLLFSSLGVGPAEAFSLSLVTGAMSLTTGVIGAGAFLGRYRNRRAPAPQHPGSAFQLDRPFQGIIECASTSRTCQRSLEPVVTQNTDDGGTPHSASRRIVAGADPTGANP